MAYQVRNTFPVGNLIRKLLSVYAVLSRQADIAVNWCPALGTVLANEEVGGEVYFDLV